MDHLCDFQMPFKSFIGLGLIFLSILVSLEVRIEKHGNNYIYHIYIYHNILQTPKYYRLLELGDLTQSCITLNVLREDNSRELTFMVSYLY